MSRLKFSLIVATISIMMAVIGYRFQAPNKIRPYPMEPLQPGPCGDGFNTSKSTIFVEGLCLIYESYKVTTPDGYILNLNRIIHPDRENAAQRGVPVLFVNGMAMHSEAWLIQTKPELNIPVAYLLNGYDVWLGDQRGSVRSRGHIHLSDSQWQYWDFSFHETGVHDLPVFIDFVLFKTGHPKLVYSGVSLGGTFYYVMCSERPEYQEKLYGVILWQPVGEVPDISSMPLSVSINLMSVQRLLQLLWSMGKGETPPYIKNWRKGFHECTVPHEAAHKLARMALGGGCHFQEDICLQIMASLGGTSARTVLHTIQLFRNGGVFEWYDYGESGNLLTYGQSHPPVYNVNNLTVPTAIYTSDIDIYAPTQVVARFSNQFKGATYLCEITGACHGFGVIDLRAGPFVRDSINVLNSMTGQVGYAKMTSGQCFVPEPTFNLAG